MTERQAVKARRRQGATPAGEPQANLSRSVRQRHREFRARVKQNRTQYLAYRIFIGVLGALIVGIGILLLPFPGPGWLVIFAGLGVWATEFTWAQRLLRWTQRQVRTWTQWLGRQALWVKGLALLALLLLLGALAAGYVAWQGVPAWVPFLAP